MKQTETKRLECISFGQLLKWLHRNHNKLPIFFLGGRNHFYVCFLNDTTVFFKGETDDGLIVDNNIWDHVMDYMRSLGDKESNQARYYTRPYVVCEELRTNPYYGPNFPAICKAYWTYHKR